MARLWPSLSPSPAQTSSTCCRLVREEEHCITLTVLGPQSLPSNSLRCTEYQTLIVIRVSKARQLLRCGFLTLSRQITQVFHCPACYTFSLPSSIPPICTLVSSSKAVVLFKKDALMESLSWLPVSVKILLCIWVYISQIKSCLFSVLFQA